MRRSAVAVLTALAAIAAGGVDVVHAQYYPAPPPGYYPPPPPYPYGPPRDYDRPYYDRPCPRGFTVQGGVCQPYRGPTGGGWHSWNGCPPGYTVQGGQCSPYRGR